MLNFASVRGALATRKNSSEFVSDLDRMPVLWFIDSETMKRLEVCTKVRDEITHRLGLPQMLSVFPGHMGRDYDHLECRIRDNNEEQIAYYFKVLEILPDVCEKLSIPYIIEKPL